jgi:hypothetical protein
MTWSVAMEMTALETWHFRQQGNGVWAWQHSYAHGGASGFSLPHGSFGSAIADAISHGFSPQKHQWEVEDNGSITYFEPGQVPRPGRK